MANIKIHVFHCGKVCVAPDIPFGGEKTNIIKASGLLTPKDKRLWLPVSAYLIEYENYKILVDTGWSREISPQGVYDKKAQIKHMSRILYKINQAIIPKGQTIDEQLKNIGIQSQDIDYVLLTHLDCDHVSGIKTLKNAKHILVSKDEVKCAQKNRLRYTKTMWEGINLEQFNFKDTNDGPFHKSYDLLGDGVIKLINIPGHSDGLFAVKITYNNKYVLLFSDGGYASKSWKEMILPGISMDKEKQYKSLQWIRDMSLNENCIESLANHDSDIKHHIITF